MENIDTVSYSSSTQIVMFNNEQSSLNETLNKISLVASAVFRSATISFLGTAIFGTLLGLPTAHILNLSTCSALSSSVMTLLNITL